MSIRKYVWSIAFLCFFVCAALLMMNSHLGHHKIAHNVNVVAFGKHLAFVPVFSTDRKIGTTNKREGINHSGSREQKNDISDAISMHTTTISISTAQHEKVSDTQLDLDKAVAVPGSDNCTQNRRPLVFQHSRIPVTRDGLHQVQMAKKKLLQGVVLILEEIGIPYVIMDGALLEYLRGQTIVHDDDLDIRYENEDCAKIANYSRKLNFSRGEYFHVQHGIVFDGRLASCDSEEGGQLHNGVQARLDEHASLGFEYDAKFQVHLDLVPAIVHEDSRHLWRNAPDVFFNPERAVFLGVKVWKPNPHEAQRYLRRKYRGNYMVPDRWSKLCNDSYWQNMPGESEAGKIQGAT
eukprot:gnl/MRDRNA2_/MRDRNA2_42400_c0_seq1.p1 gnl/MRDRNA2_/MRDRNA2_42400_c0~~gnl/MRDRNA2_/MRDRNA2_42400_c0_seq1.p1  ORF type:complete len:350 (-),score=31.94 gnl/MRDRNA2_/MRDRNA2_42400_c0_seq1:436-1485(-)